MRIGTYGQVGGWVVVEVVLFVPASDAGSSKGRTTSVVFKEL